ncbi:hypothetical protein CASFOL_014667 [Castilleja foliolosa]|uniref:Uncharacterized protein n=1 Tax=Castilleja foliolosa TaxID=1961234 RepID=A0ABD3DF25_9LAMI
MSAIVCGKRSFFEDVESAASSPNTASSPAFKKFRHSSSVASPVRFAYSPSAPPSPVDQLKAMFPDMEIQDAEFLIIVKDGGYAAAIMCYGGILVTPPGPFLTLRTLSLLAKAFEESGDNLNSAINTLNGLWLDYAKKCNSGIAAEDNPHMEKYAVSSEEPQPQNNLPEDGAEWVNLIVNEMKNATSVDDAKSRTARVLENLEKSIRVQTGVQVSEGFHKENLMLKEQIEALIRDNSILKRAVAIQHERQKEYDEKNQEVLQLKQLVAQYQEQLRTLEMNNYALTLQLRQAQLSKAIVGRFNPDVF